MEIIGYENYLIYDDGRVYNKKFNRFLKPITNSVGYKGVHLSKEGKSINKNVHRLVALHYINNPNNKRCVDHINRNKIDNRVENLRWATDFENSQNRTINKDNTSGYKNISYNKSSNYWEFSKLYRGKQIRKRFKSKIDCICYKFIIILMIYSESSSSSDETSPSSS